MCHLSVVCLIASSQSPRSGTVSVTVTAAYQICPVQSIAPCASSPLSSGVTRGREAQGAVAAPPPGAASEGSQNTHSHFIASSPGRRRMGLLTKYRHDTCPQIATVAGLSVDVIANWCQICVANLRICQWWIQKIVLGGEGSLGAVPPAGCRDLKCKAFQKLE